MISEGALPLRLTEFSRRLREEGLPVGTGRVLEFWRAAALLPPAELYWAGRVTLVSRPEDLAVYDRAFEAFFLGEGADHRPEGGAAPEVRLASSGPQEAADDEEAGTAGRPGARIPSAIELLRRKRFEPSTEREREQLESLTRRFERVKLTRRSRRKTPARRGELDFRRTARRSLRTLGEPLELRQRRAMKRSRRLTFLIDISGSMTPYTRAALRLSAAAVRGGAAAEVFCFGTRVTRVSETLAESELDSALLAAAEQVGDWDGGTRIGASLKRLLDSPMYLRHVRGSIAVILSDGLEVGDPADLSEQMARLARLAHRVVWLNPLKRSPKYRPLAGGMRAALPHVDRFESGHDLEGTQRLLVELSNR